jgi:phosphoribosylanthranilate isomerase
LLQFHGSEEDAFCRSYGLPFLKSLPMAGGAEEALAASRRYPSALAFLLDGHGPGEAGGSGRSFDWSSAPRPARPVFLAGGLAPANVGAAIRAARPYAVDVSSGIEVAPGQKDGERMRAFLEEVRRVDSEQHD